MFIKNVILVGVVSLCFGTPIEAQDLVEFVSGAKVRGKMKEIRKADKEFDFAAKIGSRTIMRTYPFGKIHAVTMNGRRHVITPKSGSSTTTEGGRSNKSNPGRTGSGRPAPKRAGSGRSKAEIQRRIQDVGSTPPDWFAATPLSFPKSLDLAWPLKPPTKGWHPQKNVSQYIWTVIFATGKPNTWALFGDGPALGVAIGAVLVALAVAIFRSSFTDGRTEGVRRCCGSIGSFRF